MPTARAALTTGGLQIDVLNARPLGELRRLWSEATAPLPLTARHHFHYSGNVKLEQIIDALGALAQRSRLDIFRLLVETGPDGLAAGAIAEKLELPAATLSFHMAHLARAGLVHARQDGRFIFYSANFDNMNALVGYLTENCCSGGSCAPACAPAGSKPRRRVTAKA